ncbi:hypothetical protein D3C74_458490 [compost metagenome]
MRIVLDQCRYKCATDIFMLDVIVGEKNPRIVCEIDSAGNIVREAGIPLNYKLNDKGDDEQWETETTY